MKHNPIACILLLVWVFSNVCRAAEEESVFQYQAVITGDCRVNSEGELLRDAATILVQERAIAHRENMADEGYFTTPERRAEIPGMLARGEFNDLEETIVKQVDPVIMVFVYRIAGGSLAMRLGMRLRDQDGFDPADFDDGAGQVSEPSVQADSNQLDSLKIGQSHPDYDPIIALIKGEVEELAEEPTDIHMDVRVLDGWAKAEGRFSPASGKSPANSELESYFESGHIVVLRQTGGRWKLLKSVMAIDEAGVAEMVGGFPAIPKLLFARAGSVGESAEEASGRDRQAVEKMPKAAASNGAGGEVFVTSITRNDTHNSKGVRIGDPVLILMQDRANVHRFGNPDGDEVDRFFKSASNRAKIRTYLSRGSLPKDVRGAILSGKGGEFVVSVYQNEAGKNCVDVGFKNGAGVAERAPKPRKRSAIADAASVDLYELIDSASNIREGPGTNYPIIRKSRKGEDGEYQSGKMGWMKLQFADGSMGWVHEKNLEAKD